MLSYFPQQFKEPPPAQINALLFPSTVQGTSSCTDQCSLISLNRSGNLLLHRSMLSYFPQQFKEPPPAQINALLFPSTGQGTSSCTDQCSLISLNSSRNLLLHRSMLSYFPQQVREPPPAQINALLFPSTVQGTSSCTDQCSLISL